MRTQKGFQKSGVREAVDSNARLSPVSRARRLPAVSSRRAASLTMNIVFFVALLGMLAYSAGCGGRVDLESRWRSADVYIDGVNTEWSGATTYFEDKKLSVGLQNDDEYLYVALFVGDPQTKAQIVMQGCTMWFDPSGEGEEEFGVPGLKLLPL